MADLIPISAIQVVFDVGLTAARLGRVNALRAVLSNARETVLAWPSLGPNR